MKWMFLLLLFFSLSVVTAKEKALPIQLATVYKEDIAVDEYWVSEKLDGIRGYWDGAQLYTRQGYKINAPAWFIKKFPPIPLDGELWLGRGTFEQIASLVAKTKEDDEKWLNVRFMLFDLPGNKETFDKRVLELVNIVKRANSEYLQVIEQVKLADEAELFNLLHQIVAAGGEGVMLHHGAAFYRQGRSEQLMKLKVFDEGEAVVISYVAGKGKYSEVMGAIVVKTNQGIVFKLGSGFSDAERANPPNIGSVVEYKHTGFTKDGKPRFASFLRVKN